MYSHQLNIHKPKCKRRNESWKKWGQETWTKRKEISNLSLSFLPRFSLDRFSLDRLSLDRLSLESFSADLRCLDLRDLDRLLDLELELAERRLRRGERDLNQIIMMTKCHKQENLQQDKIYSAWWERTILKEQVCSLT